MSDEDLQRIRAAWTERGVSFKPCPVCAKPGTWVLAPTFTRLAGRAQQDGPPMANDYGYPLVPVVCNNCGNTLLFNVLMLGLGAALDASPEEGAESG
jgi:hypothetical protein